TVPAAWLAESLKVRSVLETWLNVSPISASWLCAAASAASTWRYAATVAQTPTSATRQVATATRRTKSRRQVKRASATPSSWRLLRCGLPSIRLRVEGSKVRRLKGGAIRGERVSAIGGVGTVESSVALPHQRRSGAAV